MKKPCMYFVIAVVLVLPFLGCKTIEYVEKPVYIDNYIEKRLVMIPLTDSIITEVGGMERTPEFQYYISKTINLSLVEGQIDSSIDHGQVRRVGSTIRDNVTISAYKPGIILQSDPSGSTAFTLNSLNIAFEKQSGDPAVPFGKRGSGSNARYEILYSDDATRRINYGGIYYTVSFNDPGEPPYLMITIEETAPVSQSSREVTGLTLDER